MGARKFLFFIVLLALLTGFVFSLRWALPLWNEPVPHSYTPIRWTPVGWGDDQLYFSQVQNVLQGKLLWRDPASYEGSLGNRFPVHVTYSGSLILCALGGLLSGSIDDAYRFTLFFFPALGVLLMAWIGYQLTGNSYLSLFSAVLSLGSNRFIDHIPYPIVCQIPLLLLIAFLLRAIHRGSRFRSGLPIALIVGLSPITSVPNLFLSAGLFVVFFLFFSSRSTRVRWIAVGLLSTVVALPFILLLFKNRPVFEELLELAMPPIRLYSDFEMSEFLKLGKYLVFPIALFGVCEFPNRRRFLAIHVGIFLAFCLLAGFRGTFTGWYIFYVGRNAFCLSLFAGVLSIVHQAIELRSLPLSCGRFRYKIPMKWLKRLELVTHRPRWAAIALVVFSLCTLARAATWSMGYAKFSESWCYDRDFRQLATWAEKNTRSGDVAVTLDFDVVLNLIVYAPIDVYIPPAIVSPISEADRLARLFETARFYGRTPDDLDEWLGRSTPLQASTFWLALFYGKHRPTRSLEMDGAAKEQVGRGYREAWAQLGSKLSFRATHLILSRDEILSLAPDSPAAKIIQKRHPVFENARYRVYLL